jgi:hypothetical protein
MVSRFLVSLSTLLLVCWSAVQPAAAQPKYQYESEGILVSLPTADEPKVAQFGTDSLLAAAQVC